MSVYAGFPAALNGLAAVREVFERRGIALPLPDEAGEGAQPAAAGSAGSEPATMRA
jgi:hypothetical protein